MLKSLSLVSVLSVSQAVKLDSSCMPSCPTTCDNNEEHKDLEPEEEEAIEEEMEEAAEEVAENIERILDNLPVSEPVEKPDLPDDEFLHIDEPVPIVPPPAPIVEPEPVIIDPVIPEPIIDPVPIIEEPVIDPVPVIEDPVVIEEPIVDPAPISAPIIEEPIDEPKPIVEPEPIAEPEPVPEPVIELDPIEPLHATLWTELGCQGKAHKIYVNEDGSPYNMDYAEIITTEIGDNSLSSLQVPKGWEILAWQHDFYGETRLFQAIETDMACADMDEFADNEASALTVRKLTEQVDPEPEMFIEPVLPPEPIDEPEMFIEPVLPPEPIE